MRVSFARPEPNGGRTETVKPAFLEPADEFNTDGRLPRAVGRSGGGSTVSRLLVPVGDSETLRETVAAAVERALEGEVSDPGRAIHFVVPLAGSHAVDRAGDLPADVRERFERVVVWAEEDLGDRADAVAIETNTVAEREYLFSPGDYAEVFAEYVRVHDLDTVLFDPGFRPTVTARLLPTLSAELEWTGIAVEAASVERSRQRPRLVRRVAGTQVLALFGVSFVFFLALAGSVAPFELATGAVSAAIVTSALWGISITAPIDPLRAVGLLARLAVYSGYLLVQIAIANVEIAAVVLHPRLPIEPSTVEFDAAVASPLAATTLANSITLTPGTLTVDIDRQQIVVHALTASARADLLDGSLERAVRFVFFGWAGLRIPSPRDREWGEES